MSDEFNIGQYFQTCCRSLEWKAAMIVYEKYKRKLNLKYEDLVELKNNIVKFSGKRIFQGKKINKDILVQEASKIIKNEKKI